MYSYNYDAKTGGLLLNSTPTQFSKEPRPVYSAELDLLGFNKYWKYQKTNDTPLMWAEANFYWYRGKLAAKLKGGSLYQAPEIIIPTDENGESVVPEENGGELRPVDIEGMVESNKELLAILEQTTVKKILEIYNKYKQKLDLFHVAFSGGKDSIVLLDLVKKILPKGSFVVVFGDTGMEFPDTYEVVEKTKKLCEEEDIQFYTAKSHLDPKESWKLFGPPSRVLRWCCSVHKSTPQTLKLREVTGKNDYSGLAFVGVRAYESAARSEYEYENYGKKQKGQYSFNAILEWTSAEIWLYIYANNILINEAYKKGSARVGCICCPMGGGKSNYVEHINYKNITNQYLTYIKDSNARNEITEKDYLSKGGWNARKNGRFLTNNKRVYSESVKNNEFVITVIEYKTDWKEWIKTLGDLVEAGDKYTIIYNGKPIKFIINNNQKGYTVRIKEAIVKNAPLFRKHFRYVFRKAAYCVICKTCQASCKNGCISFQKKLSIKNCKHCFDCHSITVGCLAYHSLTIPVEDKMTLNTLSNHAPKTEWLKEFFEQGNDYIENNTLGRVQKPFFKRFLRDSGLIEKTEVTKFFELGNLIKWNSEAYLGLVLVNLAANNAQVEWYVKEFEINFPNKRAQIEDKLIELGQSKDNNSSIINAYKRLVETPLGTVLHFGYVTEEGDLVRTKCTVSDPRVLLYGLFKFAEKCGNYREFTLATLMNTGIERDGISPTQIFGLEREDMTPMLLGLTAKYPDFINATFTNDLEKITIKEGKTSQDVLKLFEEEGQNG